MDRKSKENINEPVKEVVKFDDRSKCFCLVLNCPNEFDFNNWFFNLDFSKLNVIVSKYVYILHTKDKKEFNSNLNNISSSGNNLVSSVNFTIFKTPHIHLLIYLSKRRRMNSVLKEIASLLDMPLNCVSIRICNNIPLALNYFIHFGFNNKFQYSFSDLKTNSFSWLFENFNASQNAFNDYLLDCVLSSSGDYVGLVKCIGLEYAKKYKDIIYMIYRKNKWL